MTGCRLYNIAQINSEYPADHAMFRTFRIEALHRFIILVKLGTEKPKKMQW